MLFNAFDPPVDSINKVVLKKYFPASPDGTVKVLDAKALSVSKFS
jgi:hypothetical protein